MLMAKVGLDRFYFPARFCPFFFFFFLCPCLLFPISFPVRASSIKLPKGILIMFKSVSIMVDRVPISINHQDINVDKMSRLDPPSVKEKP